MCSVIGYMPVKPDEDKVFTKFGRIFQESRIRGVHAFGIFQPMVSGEFYRHSRRYEDIIMFFNPKMPAVAHCRYSTSGDWENMSNAQPIIAAGYAFAMNGVIHMGTKEQYESAFDVECQVDNDAEIFPRRLEKGDDPLDFVSRISGSFAGVWLDRMNGNHLYAVRNSRRPLYRLEEDGAVWYGSTKDIFHRAGFTKPTEVAPLTLHAEIFGVRPVEA